MIDHVSIGVSDLKKARAFYDVVLLALSYIRVHDVDIPGEGVVAHGYGEAGTQARFWIGVMVVPGCLLLLRWLAGAMQLRHVLVHGDVSVGHVTRVVRVPLVMPEMLSVRYEFVDHRAIRRSNRHWVRARGELGGTFGAVAGDEDHGNVRPAFEDAAPQFDARFPGHDDVADHEVSVVAFEK